MNRNHKKFSTFPTQQLVKIMKKAKQRESRMLAYGILINRGWR